MATNPQQRTATAEALAQGRMVNSAKGVSPQAGATERSFLGVPLSQIKPSPMDTLQFHPAPAPVTGTPGVDTPIPEPQGGGGLNWLLQKMGQNQLATQEPIWKQDPAAQAIHDRDMQSVADIAKSAPYANAIGARVRQQALLQAMGKRVGLADLPPAVDPGQQGLQ